MGKRQSSAFGSGRQWRRVNRRALRLAVFVVLLPVPAALAAPQAATLPTEQLVAMSQVPVHGVGDTVLPRVLPLDANGSKPVEPAASLTQLQKAQRAKAAASDIAANGIPAAALRAYRTAEATMSVADPGCRLSWQLLAGIGRIESDHGRYNGAILGADGISTPAIIGLPLDGTAGVAAIADTDNGALDGDTRWDRAVGPMQFIPSTWAMVGVDGDADGTRNPHDIDDAALAAAAYLCVGEYDLSTPIGAQQAVYSYNHSADYVALVLGVAHAYASGQVDLPLLTATLQLPTGTTVNLPQGRSVPIDATDDVSGQAKDKPAAKGNRADPGDDRAQEGGGNGAGNGAGHRTDGSPDRDPAGSNDRTGDDRTSDGTAPGGSHLPDTDDPAGGGGGGGGNRADGTDNSTDEADGKAGDADGQADGGATEKGDADSGGTGGTGGSGGSGSGSGSGDVVEEPEVEEPDAVTTPLGTGHLIGTPEELYLELDDGTEILLAPSTDVDVAWIENPDVVVYVERTTTTPPEGESSDSDSITLAEAKED